MHHSTSRFFSGRAITLLLSILLLSSWPQLNATASAESLVLQPKSKRTLRVLFIGNSYTARHNLAKVVKQMAEEGQAGLTLEPTSVIYGGRRLADHWRLGTANYLKLPTLTVPEQQATVDALVKAAADPKDRHAKSALSRHRGLLNDLESQRVKFDVVVLQSYRDDLSGSDSLYMKFAPKFAQLAQAQGARVVLYETSPTTQNAQPLKAPPAADAVMQKAKAMADLANRLDASVAPMSLVAHRCQTQRPDLTLRFENDAHLNHTMAYLTACSLYAALFNESPQGLKVDSITDIRFWKNTDRSKDRDGKPITRKFSAKDKAELQSIAWAAIQQFKALRGKQTN